MCLAREETVSGCTWCGSMYIKTARVASAIATSAVGGSLSFLFVCKKFAAINPMAVALRSYKTEA